MNCPKCGKLMWCETDRITGEPVAHCLCGKIVYLTPPKKEYPDAHLTKLDEMFEGNVRNYRLVCPECKKVFMGFHNSKYCPECSDKVRNRKTREWQKKNKEKNREYGKKFKEKNPDYWKKRKANEIEI